MSSVDPEVASSGVKSLVQDVQIHLSPDRQRLDIVVTSQDGNEPNTLTIETVTEGRDIIHNLETYGHLPKTGPGSHHDLCLQLSQFSRIPGERHEWVRIDSNQMCPELKARWAPSLASNAQAQPQPTP